VAIGVDTAPNRPLRGGVLAILAGADERWTLTAHAAGVCWDGLLVSAKELI